MPQKELLEQLGLSPNEAGVYLALLQFKRATVTNIAETAHLNRTTAYDVLSYLHQKGLVLKYVENRKIGFGIDTPKRLKHWVEENKKKIVSQEKILAEHFGELEQVFKARKQTPRIQFFEGKRQMEDFFNNSLNPENQEIVGYASTTLNMTFAELKFIRFYTKRRAELGIKGRYFVQSSEVEKTKMYMAKFYRRFLKTNPSLIRAKVLPETPHSEPLNETTVYGNRFATCHVEDDFFGVIIESERIAATQRAIFESLWKTVKEDIKV